MSSSKDFLKNIALALFFCGIVIAFIAIFFYLTNDSITKDLASATTSIMIASVLSGTIILGIITYFFLK
jgi:hypothetical protein